MGNTSFYIYYLSFVESMQNKENYKHKIIKYLVRKFHTIKQNIKNNG